MFVEPLIQTIHRKGAFENLLSEILKEDFE